MATFAVNIKSNKENNNEKDTYYTFLLCNDVAVYGS